MSNAIRNTDPDGLVSIRPPSGFISGTVHTVTEIVKRRELFGLLVKREFRSRYKDSSLGLVWSLLRPLALLGIYFVAIGKFLGAEREIPNFAIYVFAGLTLWSLFAEVVSSGTSSIVNNAGLIKKVDLPREIFPLSSAGTAFINSMVQFGVLLVATFVVLAPPRLEALWTVPVALIIILTYSVALALLLSAWNVYLRDIQHLVEIALLVLFWASPIVYSYKMVHSVLQGNWLEQVYLANPITPAIIAFQQGMWSSGDAANAPADLPLRLLISFAISVVLLIIGQRVFARLEGNFAQEL